VCGEDALSPSTIDLFVSSLFGFTLAEIQKKEDSPDNWLVWCHFGEKSLDLLSNVQYIASIQFKKKGLSLIDSFMTTQEFVTCSTTTDYHL